MAEGGQLLVALVGEEGDQADRLQELEHAAGDVRHGLHHACGHSSCGCTSRQGLGFGSAPRTLTGDVHRVGAGTSGSAEIRSERCPGASTVTP